MPLLELGVLPLSCDLREGLKVAFIITVKKGHHSRKIKEVRFGRCVSVFDGGAVIEDIAAPGSRYNRSKQQIYEVHKDSRLEMFE